MNDHSVRQYSKTDLKVSTKHYRTERGSAGSVVLYVRITICPKSASPLTGTVVHSATQ